MDKQNCFRKRRGTTPTQPFLLFSATWKEVSISAQWIFYSVSMWSDVTRTRRDSWLTEWLTAQRSINLSWAGECWWGADEAAVVSCKFSWSSEWVSAAKIWSALTAIPIVIMQEDFIPGLLAAESNISERVTSPTLGTSFPKVLVGPNYSGTTDKLQFYYGRR